MKKPSVNKNKKAGEGKAEFKVWTCNVDFDWPEQKIISLNLEKDFLEKANKSLCEVAKWFKAFDLGYKCAGGGSNSAMARMAKNIENIANLHDIMQSNLDKENLKEKENKITIKK